MSNLGADDDEYGRYSGVNQDNAFRGGGGGDENEGFMEESEELEKEARLNDQETFLHKATTWVSNNQSMVMGGGVLVIAAVVLFVVIGGGGGGDGGSAPVPSPQRGPDIAIEVPSTSPSFYNQSFLSSASPTNGSPTIDLLPLGINMELDTAALANTTDIENALCASVVEYQMQMLSATYSNLDEILCEAQMVIAAGRRLQDGIVNTLANTTNVGASVGGPANTTTVSFQVQTTAVFDGPAPLAQELYTQQHAGTNVTTLREVVTANPTLLAAGSNIDDVSLAEFPSASPSQMPSLEPSMTPSRTTLPSSIPSHSPSLTLSPSAVVSMAPSEMPVVSDNTIPSKVPTATPTKAPIGSVPATNSSNPSNDTMPSAAPTTVPATNSSIPSNDTMPSAAPTTADIVNVPATNSSTPTNDTMPSAAPTTAAPTTVDIVNVPATNSSSPSNDTTTGNDVDSNTTVDALEPTGQPTSMLVPSVSNVPSLAPTLSFAPSPYFCNICGCDECTYQNSSAQLSLFFNGRMEQGTCAGWAEIAQSPVGEISAVFCKNELPKFARDVCGCVDANGNELGPFRPPVAAPTLDKGPSDPLFPETKSTIDSACSTNAFRQDGGELCASYCDESFFDCCNPFDPNDLYRDESAPTGLEDPFETAPATTAKHCSLDIELPGCISYAKCHHLRSVFDPSPIPLAVFCSPEEIERNPNKCLDICSPHMCCFSTDDDNCLMDRLDVCTDFAPCQNLRRMSKLATAPLDLDYACLLQFPECEESCEVAECCAYERSFCLQNEFLACLTYAPCAGASNVNIRLNKQFGLLPKPPIDLPTVCAIAGEDTEVDTSNNVNNNVTTGSSADEVAGGANTPSTNNTSTGAGGTAGQDQEEGTDTSEGATEDAAEEGANSTARLLHKTSRLLQSSSACADYCALVICCWSADLNDNCFFEDPLGCLAWEQHCQALFR